MSPAGSEVRLSKASVAALIVALVVALGASGVLTWRVVDLGTSLTETRDELTTLTKSSKATNRRLKKLRVGLASDLNQLAAASGETAERVGALEAEKVDLPVLIEEVKDSVVTVHLDDGSTGSGFAIKVARPPSGHASAIVTAHHVIAPAISSRGTVSVGNGDELVDAEIWDWDRHHDLALLFVTANVPPLRWASNEGRSPVVGDTVIAIGNSLGEGETATDGIVTRLDEDFLVTNATINFGNSGGPLLNRFGEVLGVNVLRVDPFLGEGGYAVKMERACLAILDCGT